MAIIDKRNYIQGDTETITDQDIGTFSLNVESYVSLDGYFKFLIGDVVIKLKSTSAVLVLGSDYELITDTRYTNKEAETGGTGKDVFSQIKIINATYAGVDLTFSGSNFGTYTDNEAVWSVAAKSFQEYNITASDDETVVLSLLDTSVEYTFNRNGAGSGFLIFSGDIYWDDGTYTTDLSVNGSALLTIIYTGSNWKIKTSSIPVRAEYTGISTTSGYLNYATEVEDIYSAVTVGTNWIFTAPISGVYCVSGTFYTAVDNQNFRFYKNGTVVHQLVSSVVSGGRWYNYNYSIRLAATDYIAIYSPGTFSAVSDTVIVIDKLN
jgi:hypothetical protein